MSGADCCDGSGCDFCQPDPRRTSRDIRRNVANVAELVDAARFESGDMTRQAMRRHEEQERREHLAAGRVPPLYVAVTRTFRMYGGPEEGGWYYDRTDLEEVRRAYGWKGVLKLVRELRREHPTDRYGRGSVLGNSGDVVLYLSRTLEPIERLATPPGRPRYE